ncbi:IS30 family (Tra8) [Fructobacillus fructosus]|nr:IS30 family (Tra8) [Fructobacillus fructosus]
MEKSSRAIDIYNSNTVSRSISAMRTPQWERASNELFNRKLRYFFPKKSNFRGGDEQRLYEAIELINNRPMKLHNYQTPLEVFRVCSN